MPEQRNSVLSAIRADRTFDVVVVGGGINGIGVFRELALQGLRVLLVERNDFASGCTAAPSRMIHGGLRYLENGEFSLVRESLRERDALLANAPHMVRPLPTTVPITSLFSGLLNGAAGFLGLGSRPAQRGALPIKIGLSLYDWTTRRRRVLPPHRFRGAGETLRIWPKLTPRLRFSATYYDAWISYPERLAIELLLDAERLAPHSLALNHAEMVREATGLVLQDKLSGERLEIAAKTIVNATGAWLNEAISRLNGGQPSDAPHVAGTKGSHIVLDAPELHDALGGHMVFFEHEDGRVCIVFPYLGRVLAGATDIRVEKAERVACTEGERDYILAALRGVFPSIALGPGQVVFSFSGIRPLPKSDQQFTGRITRGHFVHRLQGPVPQFCMVGGKWTTFRAFAEQTANRVLAELGQKRTIDTLGLPIGGGAGFPAEAGELQTALVRQYGIAPERAGRLADLYGTRAHAVLAFSAGRPDDTPLCRGTGPTGAELVFLIRHEFCVHLGDLLLRRLPLAINGTLSGALIDAAALVAARELGWNDEARRTEIASFLAELETFHGVTPAMLAARNTETTVCA